MNHQYGASNQQLIHRLAAIEGHVRSLKKMVHEGRPYLEVLMQLSAVRAAITRLSYLMFEEFVEATLHELTAEGGTDAIAEIQTAMEILRL